MLPFVPLEAFVDVRKSPFTAGQLFNNGIDVDARLPRKRRLAPTEARFYNQSAACFHPFQRFQQLRSSLNRPLRLVPAYPHELLGRAFHDRPRRILRLTAWI